MAMMTPLGPLSFPRGHGGAALTAETMGSAKSGELPGPSCEAKALFVPRHHELAQRGHGPGLRLCPQIQQMARQAVPLVEALEGGGVQMGGQNGAGPLWNAPLFIQQDEVIAPQHEPEGLFS